MKAKNILLGILFLMTFSIYGQTEKSEKTKTGSVVTELKVEAKSLEELTNFNWNVVKEMFRENDAEQEITLVFAYLNPEEINSSEVQLNNFEMKLTGKTADLDKLTARLQNTFEKMYEFNEQITKN